MEEEYYVPIKIQLPILKQPLIIHIPHQHIITTNNSSLKAMAYSLCHQHNIPPYYTVPILSTLTTICQQLNLSYIPPINNSPTSNTPLLLQQQQSRQDFINKYQDNTIQYHIKPEEDDFPRAFSTLIKSPIGSIFDALLKLDQSYSLYINDLLNKHHQVLIQLQSSHAQEMDLPLQQQQNQSFMNQLFTKHVEEMELMQATFASDILQTHQHQRKEYRDFVMELYREYQLRLAHIKNNQSQQQQNENNTSTFIDLIQSIDGKELVDLVASRTWKKNDSSSISSSNSFSSSTSPNPYQQQNRSRQGSIASNHFKLNQQDPSLLKMVDHICEMGFTKNQAEVALLLTNNQNVQLAIDLLVDNIKQVDDYIDYQQSKRKSTSSFHSLQENNDTFNHKRNSFQKLISTTPSPPPPPTSTTTNQQQQQQKSMMNGKSWNPISFLQQQKQAIENTNLSSVKKISGWIGKAMENFGIEHDENDPSSNHQHYSSQLVESFTINLGTAQIKTTHNLRLMVADVAADLVDPLPFDEQKELAYKAQTTMKLYTNQLNGLIVLVEKKELLKQDKENHDDNTSSLNWKYYQSGKGSNKSLFDRCQRSTEFHFPSMDQQLDTIEKDMLDHPHVLKEGSFFITRHSNLPLNQIVFHLIIDSDAILQTELSNRHPLMNGLRNILRLTYKYDISSISIPLFLLPDTYLDQPEQYIIHNTFDQQHTNWLSKRSDVLMKTVKAYLMESSRGGKNEIHNDRPDNSMIGSSGLRTIEFFIPMQPKIYQPQQYSSSHQQQHHSSSTSIISFPLSSSSTSSLPSSTMNQQQQQQQQQQQNHENENHHFINDSSTSSSNTNSSNIHSLTINTNHNTGPSLSLPSTPTTNAHPSLIPTPQVEQVFQQLRTLLVNIFRTS